MHAGEPLLRVEGGRMACQLAETFLLNQVNFQTMIATKAARIVAAAGGRPVVDFGFRRAHGADAGLLAARCAYIGGCTSTATVAAGYAWGIPTSGTMAHSYVLAFPTDVDAFCAFLRDHPDRSTLLIDTHDALTGARAACEAARITGVVPAGRAARLRRPGRGHRRRAGDPRRGRLRGHADRLLGRPRRVPDRRAARGGRAHRRLRRRHGAHDVERRADARRRLQARLERRPSGDEGGGGEVEPARPPSGVPHRVRRHDRPRRRGPAGRAAAPAGAARGPARRARCRRSPTSAGWRRRRSPRCPPRRVRCATPKPLRHGSRRGSPRSRRRCHDPLRPGHRAARGRHAERLLSRRRPRRRWRRPARAGARTRRRGCRHRRRDARPASGRPCLVHLSRWAVAAALRRGDGGRRAAPVRRRDALRPHPGQEQRPRPRDVLGLRRHRPRRLSARARGEAGRRRRRRHRLLRAGDGARRDRGGLRDHRAHRRRGGGGRGARRRPEGVGRGAGGRRRARPPRAAARRGRPRSDPRREDGAPARGDACRGARQGGDRALRRHRLGGGDGARRPRARPRARRRRADPVSSHRAGAHRRRRGLGARGRTSGREPAHGAHRPDDRRARDDAPDAATVGHPRGQRQRAGAHDRDLRPRPGAARARPRHREPHREPARLLHPLRRRRVGHRADHRPLQDRGAGGGAGAGPAARRARQAPDGRPVGRADRRGRARLHLPRRRPRPRGDVRPTDDARGGRGAHRASTSTSCGGCAPVQTGSRGSTRCPTAWDKRKAGTSPQNARGAWPRLAAGPGP